VSFDGGHQLVIVCILLGDDKLDGRGEEGEWLGTDPNIVRHQRVTGQRSTHSKKECAP
jgi:hypothetical protein